VSARSGILAGGNWIVDKLKFIDAYPQQDALANICSESISNGGSPFNVLVDLARLGVNFPLAGIGLVGKDTDGDWTLQQCATYGIDTTQLRYHEHAHTSYSDVMAVRSSGRRTFFHQRGANAFLGVEHFDFEVSQAKIFHLGYLLLLDNLDEPDSEFGTVAARVLRCAMEAGYKTSVDVVSEDSQRFAQVVLPALRYVDYCILNEFEIERTTGIATRRDGAIDLAALKQASERLLEAGVRDWVIVHFPEGACALDHNGGFVTQASLCVPQSRIVSAVGAGDAFAAGTLYGLHEEASIQTALTYGVTCAASCLFGAGTSDGILSLTECRGLETEFGFRQLR
jgi:sugar/nucleoside kinase (ribokinase family)